MSGDEPFDETARLEAEQDVLDSREAGGRIIRGGAARTVAYVGGILLGLVSTPLMVRQLGVDDFGRYVTVTSLIFIVNGLTEGGLGAIGIREYSQRGEAARDRLIRNLLGMRIALVGTGILGALAFGVVAGYGSTLIMGIGIAGVGFALSAWFGVYMVPVTAWLRLGWLAALDFLRQALTSIVIVALVVAGAALLPFFAAVPIATAVSLAAIWALVHGKAPGRPAFDVREWWPLLRDALPYAAALAVSVLYFRVGVLVSSVASSEAETGYYSLAFRIVELVSGIPVLLVGSAFPLLSRAERDDHERLRYALTRTYEVTLILGVWVAVAIGLGAPFAVDVVGGHEDFAPAIPVLAVLGGAMVGTFLIACWGHALLTLRRHAALLGANVSAFVLGTTLSVVLVQAHGAVGAAIATTATEIWLALLYAVLLTRARADLRPPVRRLPPVALAAGVALAVPLLVGMPSLVSVIVASLLFFALLALLRQIPPEILQALQLRRSSDA